jgi:ribosomal-protein-alanine N-acetyltransferase
MTEFRIRPMEPVDIDAVMSIAASLDDAPRWPRQAYEAALDPAATPERIALVAERTGAVVGFAIASLMPPQAELETIAIAKSLARCRGGSALLGELLRRLASLRIAEILLEVRASNLGAQAFYRALGLVKYGARKAYYADTGEAAILMRGIISDGEK